LQMRSPLRTHLAIPVAKNHPSVKRLLADGEERRFWKWQQGSNRED
jgi:hypothetical protein